ncbi:MAG: FG-GAP-like repeat-containing protein [Bryobacteraceae bacterium]
MSHKHLSLLLVALSVSLNAAPEWQRFAVYFGGSGADRANAVALDADGGAYVAGQITRSGGRKNAFVSKTNADGSEVLWTSYLTGESANAVAVDSRGNVWAAGDGFLSKLNAVDGRVERSVETEPVQALAVDAAGAVYAAGNGFVAKYAGFERVYLAKIAGVARGLAVDGQGAAYVTHGEALSRLVPDGAAFDYTVALGWQASAVAVDGMGAAYVTGANARVAKVTPAGDAIAFRMELAGVLEQEGTGIALDAAGNIFVTGWTNSSDFAQARGWHGDHDGFVVKLNPAGELMEATFAGTAAKDGLQAVAVTPDGSVYVAGWSEGAGLGSGPLAQLQGATDALLLKFGGTGNRAITATTTSLGASPAGVAGLGQAVLLTATVAPAGATGKVTFYDGTSVIGVGALSGVTATFTTTLLPAGTRSLRAYYAGDVNFSPSTSSSVAFTVNVTPALTFSALNGTTIAVGFTPGAIGVGDFNGDGRSDVVTVNRTSSTVSVLLANGSGGFTEAAGSPVTVDSGPNSVAVSDFNGDGRADLAVANANGNSVSILLGNGSGGFTVSPVVLTGVPFSVAAADFNGDGAADLAVTRFGQGNVGILLGNGAGGFAAATGSPVTTGGQPSDVKTGDFNSDGRVDLAVSDFLNNNVTVLLGNGSGGFAAAAGGPVAVGVGPYSIAIADFNADGKPDVATANLGAASVSVLLGNGTGGFSAAAGSPVAVGSTPQSITGLDYNGDGKVDLAIANFSDNSITVLQGNGAGGFTPATGSPFTTGTSPAAVAVGDFTGDGRVDLVVVNGTSGFLSTIPGVGATPTVVSGTPPNPVATPQTIAFVARDSDGYTNISRLYFLVNTSATIPQNSCHGYYDRAGNNFYLYNDALTTLLGPLAAGSAGTLQNGQCIVYGTGSGFVSGAGSDLTVNLRMGMLGLYATTTEKIYIWAVDNQNLGTGWVQTGSWVLGAPIGSAAPTVVSGTPANPIASPQTFTFTMRDANGSANIDRVYFLLNTSPAIPVNSCHGYYERVTNRLYLYNDSLTGLQGPLAAGSSGTLQNSQCSVDGPTSSLVSGAGTDLTITIGMSRLGSYAGSTQNVYIWVVDAEANGSGWVQTSTWGTIVAQQPPTLAAATPAASTTATQTFALTARDTNGSADIQRVYFLVNTSPTIPAGSCHGFYDRASNTIYIYNDALTALVGPLTPGVAGTIQNSQCAISGAASTVSAAGTDLALNLNITRQGSYATGSLNLYAWVTDNAGTGTGWVQASTWILPGGTQQAPTLAAATPPTSTTATQTFALTARDANGFTDIQRVYFLVNTNTTIPVGSCHGLYDRASNTIYLYNDALTALVGPLTPGVAGTIQNSQCAINGAASSAAAAGTDVVLNLNITRQGAYANGTLNLYAWVTDSAGTGTGWVLASTWNLSGGAQAPTLAAATPATSTTATQTFALTARDFNGFADIQRVYFLVNTSPTIPAGSCHGFYDRASGAIVLYNDALSAVVGPLTPGVAGTIQNSQCAVNGAASSVAASGTDVVLNLNITRQGSYATGARNLYIWVTDNSNAGTGWVQASTWTL